MAEVASPQICRPIAHCQFQIADNRLDAEPFPSRQFSARHFRVPGASATKKAAAGGLWAAEQASLSDLSKGDNSSRQYHVRGLRITDADRAAPRATSPVIAPLRRPHMSLTQKTCKLKAFARNMQVIANSRLPARSFIGRLRSMARASFERLEFEQQAEELKWPLQRTGNLPNQVSLEKLLRLCEQKHGRDAPVMRQLRRQLDAIRKPEPNAMQQFASGRGMAFRLRRPP